jgi:molybdopterin converting factor small subunit
MSPNVTVRFTGELRALADQDTLQLSLAEGATLRDAVQAVGAMVSKSFTTQVIEPLTESRPSAPLLLLNRAIRSGAGLDQPVGEGDIIAFVLPMEGG